MLGCGYQIKHPYCRSPRFWLVPGQQYNKYVQCTVSQVYIKIFDTNMPVFFVLFFWGGGCWCCYVQFINFHLDIYRHINSHNLSRNIHIRIVWGIKLIQPACRKENIQIYSLKTFLHKSIVYQIFSFQNFYEMYIFQFHF